MSELSLDEMIQLAEKVDNWKYEFLRPDRRVVIAHSKYSGNVDKLKVDIGFLQALVRERYRIYVTDTSTGLKIGHCDGATNFFAEVTGISRLSGANKIKELYSKIDQKYYPARVSLDQRQKLQE